MLEIPHDRRPIRSLSLVALVAMLCGGASMQTQRSDEAAKTAKPAAKDERPLRRRSHFSLPRGESAPAGRVRRMDCGGWHHRPARRPSAFVTLLDRPRQAQAAVYFHSPGGSVLAAMEIGRLMREHRMTAGVARTIPRAAIRCRSVKVRAMPPAHPAVNSLGDANGQDNVQLVIVYALIGATVRR